jgi:hypothetical protein
MLFDSHSSTNSIPRSLIDLLHLKIMKHEYGHQDGLFKGLSNELFPRDGQPPSSAPPGHLPPKPQKNLLQMKY